MNDNSVKSSELSSVHVAPHTSGPAPGLVPVVDGSSSGAGGGQAHISCPPQIVDNPILAHGVDTLEASIRLEIPPELLAKLEKAKKEVQETSEDCESIQFGETKLFTFAIQRSGIKNYPYVLKTGDITLCLSTRGPESPIWNARLKIGSLSCNDNLDNLLAALKNWLIHYGCKWVCLQISRIDLFIDLETPISETGIEKQDHHITRATTCSPHYEHRKLTGVQVGRSGIVLRVYDKIAEMKAKRATEKIIFFLNLWKKKPEHVTRVEFQLRREAITELIKGPSGWNDIKPALPGVFAYLVNWFRHTEDSVDHLRENNNQHLAESSQFWKKVEGSVDTWREKFGKIVKITRDRKQKHLNIAPLVEQAAGCMMSVVAALGHAHNDLFGIFNTCRELIQEKMAENMEDPRYEKKYYARAALAKVTF